MVGCSDIAIDGAGVIMLAVVGISEGRSSTVGPLEGTTDISFTTGASDFSEITGAKVIGPAVSRVGTTVGSTVGSPVSVNVGVAVGRIVGLTDGDIEWSAPLTRGHSKLGRTTGDLLIGALVVGFTSIIGFSIVELDRTCHIGAFAGGQKDTAGTALLGASVEGATTCVLVGTAII
jgi:hypothetical protein